MKKLTRLVVAVIVLGSSGLLFGDTAQPFNGRDLTGWKTRADGNTASQWKVGSAKPSAADPKVLSVKSRGHELINDTRGHGQSLDLYTTELFGDAIITLEVMVPEKSNSGIYVMGEYEVQVLDSFGKDANPGPGAMGAIYGAQPPTKPRYRKPGQWSQYQIRWQAPRFDAAGKKIANAKFLKVTLNGRVIHDNVEMPGPTPGGVDGKEKARGPLMFQGNHGPVSYRDIRVRPLK